MNTTITDALNEGLILRGRWTATLPDGREAACLLATISPECRAAESYSACPADILPEWFAEIVPWMDDYGTAEEWPKMVLLFQDTLNRWDGSTASDWKRRYQLIRAIAVREAMSHVASKKVLAMCERVASALESGAWPDAQLRADAAAAAAVHAPDTPALEAATYTAVAARAAAALFGAAYTAYVAAANTVAHTARAASVDRMTKAILLLQ